MRGMIAQKFGAMLVPEAVVDEIMALVQHPTRTGIARVLLQNGRAFDYTPALPADATAALARKRNASAAQRAQSAAAPARIAAPVQLPAQFRRWVVHRLSHKFEEATSLDVAQMPTDVPAGHVLIRRHITGVNASDVNFTSGAYHGSRSAAEAALPFTAGFESVGVVVRAPADSSALDTFPCGNVVSSF
jgi:hypothetical protein